MIQLPITDLTDVAKRATLEADYLGNMFSLDRLNYTPADVLLILNAAIASGLVRLPGQVEAERKSSYDAGYLRGYEEGYAEAVRTQEWAAAHANDDATKPSSSAAFWSAMDEAVLGDDPDPTGENALCEHREAVLELVGPEGLTDAPPTNGNGHHAEPIAPSALDLEREIRQAFSEKPQPVLSATAVATLGPEHTTVTPLRKPVGVGRVDGDSGALSGARMDKDERAADLRSTIYALQEMAVDGLMPSMEEWKEDRPAGMLTAQSIMSRHNLTWRQLATYAKLTLKGTSRRAMVETA